MFMLLCYQSGEELHPIQRSILNDDKETGICVMKVEEKLDAGPIIKLEKIKIKFDDNAGSLYKKMILVGLLY